MPELTDEPGGGASKLTAMGLPEWFGCGFIGVLFIVFAEGDKAGNDDEDLEARPILTWMLKVTRSPNLMSRRTVIWKKIIRHAGVKNAIEVPPPQQCLRIQV
jgi:hypothetical protein